MKKIKELFQNTSTRRGSFSVGVIAGIIAILIALSFLLGQLPEKFRNLDISSTNLYDISDTTKDMIKELDKNISLTAIASETETDERIATFLSKYAGLSGKISLEWVDPELHPDVATQYETEGDLLVVSCADTGKTTTIDFSEIIVQSYDSSYNTIEEFDGEGQLTAAVNNVTSTEAYQIYQSSGHGETALGDEITALMEKNSYTLEELNLLMSGSIPEDCQLLITNGPTKDLTAEEKTVLETYLHNGGKWILLLGDQSEKGELSNLRQLLSVYGMDMTDGFVGDTQRGYQGYAFSFFPELSLSGDLEKGISSEMVLLVNAKGLTVTDTESETVTVTEFMKTSAAGVDYVDENTQTTGTYTLGAVATNSETNERVTVIASSSMIDSQLLQYSTIENATLFMNLVAENFEGVSNISIPSKSLSVSYNTIQYVSWFGVLVILGIPLLLLILGFVVWIRRRKA